MQTLDGKMTGIMVGGIVIFGCKAAGLSHVLVPSNINPELFPTHTAQQLLNLPPISADTVGILQIQCEKVL